MCPPNRVLCRVVGKDYRVNTPEQDPPPNASTGINSEPTSVPVGASIGLRIGAAVVLGGIVAWFAFRDPSNALRMIGTQVGKHISEMAGVTDDETPAEKT